jgi:hypothetical protein
MTQDIYYTYAELHAKIRDLTEQEHTLQKRIVGYVSRQGGLVRKPFGTFSVVDYPKYAYSQECQAIEAKLAEVKKAEREAGVATLIASTTSLRFQSR